MKEEDGIEIVKKIVNEWSKVYINQVFFMNRVANVLKYAQYEIMWHIAMRWSSASLTL
jgi:hypothetical protein